MGAGTSTQAGNAANEQGSYRIKVEFEVSIAVDKVVAIAEAAGAKILEIYNSDLENWDVVTKTDDSPLTRADTEANAIICADLAKLSPHIPIVSEENKQMPFSIRQHYEYNWLVDPLDGTKEFISRNGQFTVNIALLQGDVPVFGVVHVPCESKTYWALKGKGAFVRFNGEQRPLQCAQFGLRDKGLTIVASARHQSQETREFVEMFSEPQFKQMGSSLKLLMVAEGAAHVYPRLAPTCEWDTAAADIIVREAGGAVLQAGKCSGSGEALEDWREALAREEPVVYNKQALLNPFFVAFGARRPEQSDQAAS